MHLISIYLALMTCPRMLVTVGFHCGPEISYPKDLLCHGMSTGMYSEGTFTISNHGVNAVEDGDNDIDSWIFPTTNGGPSNWTEKDFIPITFVQK